MYYRCGNKEKGFTLVELMIVVVIIGILASLAVPRFMQASSKAKQHECQQLLKQIYTMQRTYFQEYNTYLACTDDNDFETIGVDIPPTAHYEFSVTAGSSGDITSSFYADALWDGPALDDDMTEDHWRINDDGKLAVMVNDVTDADNGWTD